MCPFHAPAHLFVCSDLPPTWQRSELEQFFLDSLQHVKREMDKEQRHAATARRKAYQAQVCTCVCV